MGGSVGKQETAGTRTEEFSRLYREVRSDVSSALTNLSDIRISSVQGNAHLASVVELFEKLAGDFSDEIDYLDQHAEWERFTIAFFGETNAGKSTIIESLRILFQEQERQDLIRSNKAMLDDLQAVFSEKTDQLVLDLNRHYRDFRNDLAGMSVQVGDLRRLVQDDNAATREAVSREADRMIDALDARHQVFQDRMDGLERQLANLPTLVERENEETREAFAQDVARLLDALGERARAYGRDMAGLAENVAAVADIARDENDAEHAARRRRERGRLMVGIVVGLAIGASTGIAVGTLLL